MTASSHPIQNFCVAYSGGMDSHVLLHALHAAYATSLNPYSIRAVHIHHGMSPHADSWEKHCESVCQQLHVPFSSYAISIKKSPGKSLEALARDARYACLGQQLKAGEVLLTGHHADDQAETILLQLLRGSSVAGLSAMPRLKKFFNSHLLRPLLDIPRATLHAYAIQYQLDWIEDESNQCLDYNRNYIRQNIMPALTKRWPAVLRNLQRSAHHCAETQALLKEIAAQDYEQVRPLKEDAQEKSIDIRLLKKFSLLRQKQIIRFWIQQQGFLLPSTIQLDTLFKNVIYSRYDAKPLFTWGPYMIQRHRHYLYLTLYSQVT